MLFCLYVNVSLNHYHCLSLLIYSDFWGIIRCQQNLGYNCTHHGTYNVIYTKIKQKQKYVLTFCMIHRKCLRTDWGTFSGTWMWQEKKNVTKVRQFWLTVNSSFMYSHATEYIPSQMVIIILLNIHVYMYMSDFVKLLLLIILHS